MRVETYKYVEVIQSYDVGYHKEMLKNEWVMNECEFSTKVSDHYMELHQVGRINDRWITK